MFVERFINPGEVKKSGDVEVGGNVSERLSRNVEEERSTSWERRRNAAPVEVSMLGCLEGGGFRVVVVIGDVSGSF